jgi:hypothetical protein
MSTQAQIQAYASCTQESYSDVLQRFRLALEHLGCKEQAVLDWVTEITWPESDDDSFGDIYAAPVILNPSGAESLTSAGIEVSLYTQPAIPSLEELPSWVGFNILLEMQDLHNNTTDPYVVAEGYSIWCILQELAKQFPEVGAYFTAEWQDNQAWRAIVEGSGDPWVFELGIFPRSLAIHFEHIPAGFKGTLTESGFGFAQENRWQQLPWEVTSAANERR